MLPDGTNLVQRVAAAQNKIHFPSRTVRRNRIGPAVTSHVGVMLPSRCRTANRCLLVGKKMNFIHGSKMFIYSHSLIVIISTLSSPFSLLSWNLDPYSTLKCVWVTVLSIFFSIFLFSQGAIELERVGLDCCCWWRRVSLPASFANVISGISLYVISVAAVPNCNPATKTSLQGKGDSCLCTRVLRCSSKSRVHYSGGGSGPTDQPMPLGPLDNGSGNEVKGSIGAEWNCWGERLMRCHSSESNKSSRTTSFQSWRPVLEFLFGARVPTALNVLVRITRSLPWAPCVREGHTAAGVHGAFPRRAQRTYCVYAR